MDLSNSESDLTSSSQPVLSPDLFSSEDEGTYKADEAPELSASPIPSNAQMLPEKVDVVLELESSRLQRLMDLLQGIPPPPSVTIPQITLSEVLQKLKENTDNSSRSSDKIEGPVSSLWKPTASLGEVLKTNWPDIKNIVFHDMHFNRCTASEDVERVSMKLHERFIGAETSSWCNALTSMPSSAKKRQRMRTLGKASPGGRLSHLARRRQTFSSANLAQLSSVAGSGVAGGVPIAGGNRGIFRRNIINGGGAGNERRRIMVEIKKSDKNKRIKTNSKEGMSRIAQSNKAPKPVAEVEVPPQSTKRALFLSPEEQKRVMAVHSLPVASEANEVQRSKRALWPSDREPLANDYGKRSLDKTDSSTTQKAKVHCSEDRSLYSRTTRSLPFSLSHTSAGSSIGSNSENSQSSSVQGSHNFSRPSRRASDQGPSSVNSKSTCNLSELHKRKLFWAVTSALRSENITKNHANFQRLASILAFHYMDVRQNMKGPPPASTSEHMLQVVSAKASEVLQSDQAMKAGQEENQGNSLVQRKEERPNKELFRDATASLNVRRSLCVSLSSSNHQSSDDMQKQTKRVPSARKSLSFDSMHPKASSGTASDEPPEKVESKYQLDSKGNDVKWRVNGENVPLASAKRVSRSLFLSPKDDVKTAKKDASEQTCGPDIQPSTQKNMDDFGGNADGNFEGVPALDVKKVNGTEGCDSDEKLLHTSEVSSIPSVSAVSSTLEADNEASRTSEATSLSEHANSVDIPTNLALFHSKLPFKENCEVEKIGTSVTSKNQKPDSTSSESNEFASTRVLRETKERAARLAVVPSSRTNRRKSLSLSKRDLRSSSTDSTDQEHDHNQHQSPSKAVLSNSTVAHSTYGMSQRFELKIMLSPAKVPSPKLSTDSHNTSKSASGSPVVADVSYTQIHSPFLGFPLKVDLSSSDEAVKDVPDGSIKVPPIGEGSSWSETPKPEVSSEEGNMSQSDNGKIDLEEKVITPLLEAAILESSVCVGSGSCNSTDVDLSFRGRIESLKPLNVSESAINLDLGMNLNVSANLLNMDENKEKSPVLEKWAERASRSAKKNYILSEETNEAVMPGDSAASRKASENSAEESMLPWDESQTEAASQCSNVFEKFRSIFDSSSHHGNS